MKGMAKRFKRMDDDLWPTFRDSKKTRHESRLHCDSLIRIQFFLQFQCFVFLLLQSLRIWINTWRFLNSSMPWKKFTQTLQTMNCRCSGATLTATWWWKSGKSGAESSMVGRNPWCSRFGTCQCDRCPWGICCFDECCLGLYLWYMIYASILYLLSTHFRWVKDTKLNWIDEPSRFASSFEIWTNRKSERLLNSHCRWWTISYSAWNGGKVAINLGNFWLELILRILSINGSQFCCLCGTQSRVKRLKHHHVILKLKCSRCFWNSSTSFAGPKTHLKPKQWAFSL